MSYFGPQTQTQARIPEPEPEAPAEVKGMSGLGDLVDKITTKTGIKKIVNKISKATGKDCGCSKRRDKLNKAVPFRGKT